MRKSLLLLPLMVGPALMGQNVLVNGGIQAGLNAPTGDFATKTASNGDYLGANDGIGLHFGGHLDLNFNPHHQLRLHITANGFASKQQNTFSGGSFDGTRQNSFSVGQFGGDYVFNARSPYRGGYFLVGLSLNQVKATAKFSFYPDYETTQSGRAGFRIGGGYTFNRRISLEGHINSVSVEKTGSSGLGFDAITWLSVSAVMRFGGR